MKDYKIIAEPTKNGEIIGSIEFCEDSKDYAITHYSTDLSYDMIDSYLQAKELLYSVHSENQNAKQ